MKKVYIYILLSMALGIACNKEWKSELYVNNVSLVKNGLVTAYVKYKNNGGLIPYKVPIILSGSTGNPENIQVTIEVDKDTISNLNFDRFRLREDLYFHELSPEKYSFRSMTTTIPKDSLEGFYNLDLKLGDLDMVYKYILPIKIVSTSRNNVSTRKWYSKSLMQIIPFNDYSGSYSVAGKVLNQDQNQDALTTPTRTAWVVNENTVFFFAGVIEETAFDRAKYKIMATFHPNDATTGTVTLTAPDPAIKFSQQAGTYTIRKKMDDVQPYLERTYLIMNLEYCYSDITNPVFPINYKFTGPLTLEKVRNIQIPDEDQQVIVQ